MKRRTMVLYALGLAVLAVGAIALFRNPPAKPHANAAIRLRILDTRFMGLLPLYVADEQGYFRDAGFEIQWVEVRDPAQASRLFFDKQADVLMTTFANILPAEGQQPGAVRLLCPAYESSTQPGSFILTKPDSEIDAPAKLRGKTLGTYLGPSQRAYALIALRRLGLREPDDVRLVQVAPSAQVQGLFGGTFDALFTVEPYASTAIVNGARVVDAGVRPKYIADPFWIGSAVIHSEYAAAHPQSADALVAALSRAVEYIATHDTEARQLLSKRVDMTPETAARCGLYVWVPHPSATDIAQIEEHAAMLHSEGLLEKPVRVEPLFLKPSSR